MPDFSVLHYLEFAQTDVHRVGDAIQPSHPLPALSSCLQSFPVSGSFPVSQLFTSGGQSNECPFPREPPSYPIKHFKWIIPFNSHSSVK